MNRCLFLFSICLSLCSCNIEHRNFNVEDYDPYTGMESSALGFYIDGVKYTNYLYLTNYIMADSWRTIGIVWNYCSIDGKNGAFVRTTFPLQFLHEDSAPGTWKDKDGDGVYIGQYLWFYIPLENITLGEHIKSENHGNAINIAVTLSRLDYNPHYCKTDTLPLENLCITIKEINKSSIKGEFSAEINLKGNEHSSLIKLQNGVFRLDKDQQGEDYNWWSADKNRIGYE